MYLHQGCPLCVGRGQCQEIPLRMWVYPLQRMSGLLGFLGVPQSKCWSKMAGPSFQLGSPELDLEGRPRARTRMLVSPLLRESCRCRGTQ